MVRTYSSSPTKRANLYQQCTLQATLIEMVHPAIEESRKFVVGTSDTCRVDLTVSMCSPLIPGNSIIGAVELTQ